MGALQTIVGRQFGSEALNANAETQKSLNVPLRWVMRAPHGFPVFVPEHCLNLCDTNHDTYLQTNRRYSFALILQSFPRSLFCTFMQPAKVKLSHITRTWIKGAWSTLDRRSGIKQAFCTPGKNKARLHSRPRGEAEAQVQSRMLKRIQLQVTPLLTFSGIARPG